MRRPGDFFRATDGVASVELALLAPILILLSLGTFELQRYLRVERQLSLAAENVASMVAQRLTTDTTSPAFDYGLVAIVAPTLSPGGGAALTTALASQITSVVFTATPAGCTTCTYRGDVTWTWSMTGEDGPGLGSLKRACGRVTASNAQTGGALPAGVFGPGAVIVVDMLYDFKPLFGTGVVPTLTLMRQGFARPRYATSYVKVPAAADVTTCPGF